MLLLAAAFLAAALPTLPLKAVETRPAAAAGPKFMVMAVHIGSADNIVRRSTCFESRGEAGLDLGGTGIGGAGRWQVQHGFWAGAGSARSDTVFFHRFEECRP